MGTYPELAGKGAIVTGSSAGIGEAVALALAENGVNVVVNGVSGADEAEQVAARARELGGKRSFAHPAEVTQTSEVQRLYSAATERFGAVRGALRHRQGGHARIHSRSGA